MTTSLLATSPGVFLAFHQYDQHAAEQARTYLKPWLPDAYLTSWDETSIAADDNWRERLEQALAAPQAIIVLVSEGFLESASLTTELVPLLRAAAERKGTLLIPVLLEDCAFTGSALGGFPPFNDQQGQWSSYPLFDDLATAPDPFDTHEQGLLWIQLSRFLREIVDAPLPLARTQRVYQGHRDYVRSVAWSPDGNLIASGGDDGRAFIWEARTGVLRVTCAADGDILALAWSPDGTRLAWVIYGAPPKHREDSFLQLWDASNGMPLRTYRGHRQVCASLAWSPDGALIASGDAAGMIHLWSPETGKSVRTWSGHRFMVNALAWSQDGTRLASAGDDHTARLWDAATGTLLLTYQGHANRVQAVAWAPDGLRLASGSWDRQVHLWDAVTGTQALACQGHAYEVVALSWAPDGLRLASGGADRTVQLWDAATGERLLTYTGHAGWARSVAWSPDGALIASGSYDGTVQLWSPA